MDDAARPVSSVFVDASVSIVIRALNEATHIGRLLASLRSQTLQPDEVVLVDSGSSDETVTIAEQFECRVLHMPPSEFTFGRSLNWGCEFSKGEILVFVSAHVYPLEPHWLEKLVEPFQDPTVGLSYGGQTGDHRSNYAEIQLLKGWFPEEGSLDQEEPFCNNANCAIRRSLWEEFPYDEALTGLEDIAFAKQISAAGNKIAYVPEAKIAHVHEEGFRKILNRYRREAMAYQEISGRSELTLSKAVTLAAANIAGDTKTAVRDGEIGEIPSAVAFRIAQFAGAYMGYRTDDSNHRQVVRRMYYPNG